MALRVRTPVTFTSSPQMNANALFILLGKPGPEAIEAKVQEFASLYRASSDGEEKGVLLDTCRTLCEMQASQEEQAEVNAAKTSISRAAKELAELKASLREGECVTCDTYNGKSTVKWEIVTAMGERHPWESPSTLGTNLSPEMMERIAHGDKSAIREVRNRAKETVNRKERLVGLRKLADVVARMVTDGTELVVTKGSAIVTAETRAIRSEMRNRVKLIEAGKKTERLADKVKVDGKEYLSFSEVE